ncbi:LysR family transcriptional regulator [Albimonas pacifica]|uniref:Transcriptional regulator, LysR family n=1 Tax=Albimonas pacifica TaxID=1114924 RepID=A0A1I3BKG2_9RHOB|nr:LysR family transcriptional regulator [Albimonas pacifica]SFH62596.1 transcriptional regulator, LysR family [Albimonas pacifica]
MTDRYEAMATLVACVDAGSLSAGARALRQPLATVSRRVAELEARLGAQILRRSARGLTLTDAGVDYVAACRRILEELAEAERAAAGEFASPRGVLSLTAPVVFGRLHVIPVVTEFLAAFPEVDVRLALGDRPANLGEEPLDAAIRVGEPPLGELRARRLGAVSRVVVASPAYLAARGRPQAPEDLAGHDCITFTALMAPDRWRFGPQDRGVAIRSRLAVNTAEAALDAACAGAGLTRVLSYQAAAALAEGRLERVLQPHEPTPWPVHILYAPGRRARKLRAFLDFAGPRLEARLRSA